MHRRKPLSSPQFWPCRRALLAVLITLSLALPPATAQEQTLSPTGPWLVYTAIDGLIAANTDGSARTVLAPPPDGEAAFRVIPAPTGDRLILVTQNLQLTPGQRDRVSATLWLVGLPGGGSRTLLNSLLPENFATNLSVGGILAALRAEGQPVWSPGGDRVAFVSGHEDTPDVYLYYLAAGTSTRFTADPTYPLHPIWSPNGRRLVWEERQQDGWVAAVMMTTFASASGRVPDSPPTPLPLDLPPGRGWVFVGWQTPDRLIYSVEGTLTGAEGLYLYDCRDGTATLLLPPATSITPPAYDPASGTAVFAVPQGAGLLPGLYRLDTYTGVREFAQPGAFSGVRWEPYLEAFLATTPDGTLLLPRDPARPPRLLDGSPIPAPVGSAVAYDQPSDNPGLAVAPSVDALPVDVWSGAATSPIWLPDGQALYAVSLDPLTPGLIRVDAQTGQRSLIDAGATPGVLLAVAPREVAVLADVEVALCDAAMDCVDPVAVLAGDEAIAQVRGRNRAGDRLAIRLADGRQGWVRATALTYSGETAALTILAD